MARKHRDIATSFKQIDPGGEDEVLEAFSDILDALGEEDLHLHHLPQLYQKLKVPSCFVADIVDCIEYYYDVAPIVALGPARLSDRSAVVLEMARLLTVSTDEIIDVVDIDKLIRHTDKLLKFRNHYSHIYESWELFVGAAQPDPALSKQAILAYKLRLPDLLAIKSTLNLDKASLGDLFLIDMLSCCQTDSKGYKTSFDRDGASVSVKNFAEILGNLGELD